MLKGKSTIQLFDSATGKKVHEQEDSNLVTNALNNIINANYNITSAGSNLNWRIWQAATPIYKKLLGGILLFDSTLAEDKDCVIAPKDINLIGNAGGTYAGTNTYRGSYNINESGAIESGWRHVWDFATDKANGTIKSLSLTSLDGGNCGMHDSQENRTYIQGIENFNTNDSAVKNVYNSDIFDVNEHGIYVCNPENGIYIFVKWSSESLIITKVENLIKEEGISLTRVITKDKLRAGRVIETKTIKLPSISVTNISGKNVDIYMQTRDIQRGVEDGKGNIIFYSFRYDVDDTIMCNVLNVSTLEINSNIIKLNKKIPVTQNYSPVGFFHEDKIYVIKDYVNSGNQVEVYTSNGNWIKSIKMPININSGFGIIDDCIYFNGMNIKYNQVETELMPTEFKENWYFKKSKDLGLPLLIGSEERDQSKPYLFVYTPYLATIDNLSTPIIKTESQTMKIIYDIVQA